MTRIGFAYNQKPDTSIAAASQLDARADSSLAASDEEPPSFGVGGRAPAARANSAVAPSPTVLPTTDEFAEWDSPETIAAVHRALSALGEVIPLEATPDFPQRLREARPDI